MPVPVAENERASSQTVKAQLSLRDLILSGDLKPGDRISELVGGGAARHFANPDPHGAWSGSKKKDSSKRFRPEDLPSRHSPSATSTMRSRCAARWKVLRRGSRPNAACAIAVCSRSRIVSRQLDELVGRPTLSVDDFSQYVGLNGQFHALLIDAADSPVLARQIDRALNLPFASPSGFVMVQAMLPEARQILTIAQDHHHCVVRAIEEREGARAESLMREHARLAHRNLQLAFRNQGTRDLVPGAVLIKKPVPARY